MEASKQIRVLADQDWDFPNGSILVKTFYHSELRIETRLLLRGDDGALFGGEAVRFIERFRCRVALLSIGAIDLDSGFMDFHPEEAEFSQAVIAQASRVVVTADHSKFGRQATVKVCDLADVDALITDQQDGLSISVIGGLH